MFTLNVTPTFGLQEEEFYVCIYAVREGDVVLFHHEGGVEVGDVDAKALKLTVAVNDKISEEQVKEQLLSHVPENKKGYEFIQKTSILQDIFLFFYFCTFL